MKSSGSAFVVKDVYNFRSRNYLLRRLENHGRKEPVDVDSFTIEHVMPQNPDLSPAWQDDLGPDWRTVQERWLHTIGNLTLTGYNSELSDRPFSEKLTIKGGFRESPLHLNAYLAKLDTGTSSRSWLRAQHLADLALEVWPAPHVSEETLCQLSASEDEGRRDVHAEDHAALKGPIRPLFDELRKRVLNLDAGVVDEVRKQYIAFRLSTNFLEVVPLASELKLYLDISPEELDDPLDSRKRCIQRRPLGNR